MNEWISVKERLPDNGEVVLVCDEHELILMAEHYSYGWVSNPLFVKIKVTHWMPLPEPPKD